MNINSFCVSGRVGKDPEVIGSNDRQFSKFSLALSQGKDKDPIWFDCVAYGSTSDFVKNYIKRGDLIFIQGKFSERKTDDKKFLNLIIDRVDKVFQKQEQNTVKSNKEKLSQSIIDEVDFDQIPI